MVELLCGQKALVDYHTHEMNKAQQSLCMYKAYGQLYVPMVHGLSSILLHLFII